MESFDPIQRASERRFPAWTLYARALSGNREAADDLVRRALSAVEPPATEAEAHHRVLSTIRSSALNRPRLSRGGSVLELLRSRGKDDEAEACARALRHKLRSLPRRRRRSIELVLLRRPSVTLERVARGSGLDRPAFEARLERDLLRLAAVVRPEASPWQEREKGAHSALEDLLAYVRGALSGDEARAVMTHAGACTLCGDRLGTMMWLKSQAVSTARRPRISRPILNAGIAVMAMVTLLAGALIYRELAPNPWRQHATRETVPRWFGDFFYRGDKADPANPLSHGLALLSQGQYQDAIRLLEPLAEPPGEHPEAASYLGIARYMTEDFSRRTLRLLENGTSSSRAGRLARWYLASTHLARGEIRRARDELRALASIRDWFGRAAERLLERLETAENPPAVRA